MRFVLFILGLYMSGPPVLKVRKPEKIRSDKNGYNQLTSATSFLYLGL